MQLRKRQFLMLSFATVFFLWQVAIAGTGIVKGSSYVVYEFKANKTAPFLIDYSNNGFRQQISLTSPGLLVIEVEIVSTPINSFTPFPLPEGSVPENISVLNDSFKGNVFPELERLSSRLTANTSSQYDAVNNILSWVSDEIEYSANKNLRNDSLSVYRSRKGDCVGRVNLALYLLGKAGIPAREVHGLCIDGEKADYSKLGKSYFHRWIEIYYPDKGWIFSDPGRSINTVDSRYIVINPDATSPYHIACHSIRKTSYSDNLIIVDSFPGGEKGLIMRPNDNTRYSGAVVGILNGFPSSLLKDGKVSIFQDGEKTGKMTRLTGKKHFSFTELTANKNYFMKIQMPGIEEELFEFSTSSDGLKIINIKFSEEAGKT